MPNCEKRPSNSPAPMLVSLLRRGSFRIWIVILSIAILTRSKDIVAAETYIVSPEGSGDFYTLSEAMELAEPGDMVQLEDGIYSENIRSVRNGEEGSPITVIGGGGAIIKTNADRAVAVYHSHIHIEGFSVDGYHGSDETEDSWTDKGVWVDGKEYDDGPITPISGFIMRDMTIRNCGSECVRLKNFVAGAIIINNLIEDCGIYDYVLSDGVENKNGEGVYIGTSRDQTNGEEDACDFNYVTGNTFETNGNECVEIKEGSTNNVIEWNICKNQLDDDSGCFSSRGDANTIRFNEASECNGAGVRVGGHEDDGYMYGQLNNVYGNVIANAEYACLKVESDNQDLICGNVCEGEEIRGNFENTVEATVVFGECNAATLNEYLDAEPSRHFASTPSPFGNPLTEEPTPSPTIFNDDDDIVDDDSQPVTPTPSPLDDSSTEKDRTPSPTISMDVDDDDADDDNDDDDYDDDGSYSSSYYL